MAFARPTLLGLVIFFITFQRQKMPQYSARLADVKGKQTAISSFICHFYVSQRTQQFQRKCSYKTDLWSSCLFVVLFVCCFLITTEEYYFIANDERV